ncbi:hypothetical protein FAI40_03925 [Acetobacteraceae bacterium]|nr:hypothetical protein FAI40_03925 [Acetobacteraceae bacterium]
MTEKTEANTNKNETKALMAKLSAVLERAYAKASLAYEKALKTKNLLERVYQLDQAEKGLSQAFLRLAQAASKDLPSQEVEAQFKPKMEQLKETLHHARKIAIKTLDRGPLKTLFETAFEQKEREALEQLCLLFVLNTEVKNDLIKAFDAADESAFQTALERI